MAANFLLFLQSKKLYEAHLSITNYNCDIKLTPLFYDPINLRWTKNNNIISVPLYVYPKLLDYVPAIDQIVAQIENNSITIQPSQYQESQIIFTGLSETFSDFSRILVLISGIELVTLF